MTGTDRPLNRLHPDSGDSGHPGDPRGPEPVFWILRHGQSRANAEHLIISRPGPRALEWAALTELGRDQARRAAAEEVLGPQAVLVSSDYARALQTAQIVAAAWGAPEPQTDTRLRERDFGSLEEGPDTAYGTVWAADQGQGELPEGVETAAQVAARTQALVQDLRAQYPGRQIVLVAHGDVLQITQAWFSGRPPQEHRALPHLDNAQLRRLGYAPEA